MVVFERFLDASGVCMSVFCVSAYFRVVYISFCFTATKVQASAGTGKSFLLTTVYLWCIVNEKKAKACAPTGIAAANVEIEGTEVAAQTIHALLDLDYELQCKLDFAKLGNPKTSALMSLDVIFIDEAHSNISL